MYHATFTHTLIFYTHTNTYRNVHTHTHTHSHLKLPLKSFTSVAVHLIHMGGKHGLRDGGGLVGFDIHIGIH